MRYACLLIWVLLAGCEHPPEEVLSIEDTVSAPWRLPQIPVGQRSLRSPYAGAHERCESSTPINCETFADCPDDMIGRSMRCVRAYWRGPDDPKLCAVRFPGRKERRWRMDRIDHITDSLRGSTQTAKLLRLVASRETSFRPYKTHRLNPDIKANARTWILRASKYGHITDRRDGKIRVKFNKTGNPYYKDWTRWRGYGLYGQNSPIFVEQWDKMAPPEILCGEVEATYTYLFRARVAWRKFAGGIDCDRDGVNEFHGNNGYPAWEDIHRAVSTGKLCTNTRRDLDFARRAKRYDLNPAERVAYRELGVELDSVKKRNAKAKQIYAELDVVLACSGQRCASAP